MTCWGGMGPLGPRGDPHPDSQKAWFLVASRGRGIAPGFLAPQNPTTCLLTKPLSSFLVQVLNGDDTTMPQGHMHAGPYPTPRSHPGGQPGSVMANRSPRVGEGALREGKRQQPYMEGARPKRPQSV